MLTTEQRQSPDNGIHLCNKCSRMIDTNNGVGYPPTVLVSWKRFAEAAAKGRTYQNRPYNFFTVVDFSNLEQQYSTALTCTGLNERNVLSCPSDQSLVRAVTNNLNLATKCILTGPSGGGKTLLTYQIAHHFHQTGWKVVKINKKWISDSTVLAAPTTKSLIIIDDAHTIETWYLENLLGAAHADCIVLANFNTSTPFPNDAISTFPTVQIAPSTQVAMIKRFCLANKDNISDKLRSLRLRVKSTDVLDCIESRIERAAREATPWLFNYNLTEGWRTAKTDLARLKDDHDLHVVLLTVAMFQYVTLDLGVSADVVIDTLRKYKDEEDWLDKARHVLSQQCVTTDGKVRNKHHEYSRRILNIFIANFDAGADYNYLTSLLRDLLNTTMYERGHANLLEFVRFDFPQCRARLNAEGLTTELAQALLQDDTNGTPAKLDKLSSLIRINPEVMSVLKTRSDLLAYWLLTCSKDTAYPLARLLNELGNMHFGPLNNTEPLLDHVLALIISAELEDRPRYSHLINRLYPLLTDDDRNYISANLVDSEFSVDVPRSPTVVGCRQFSNVLNDFYGINETWTNNQVACNVEKIATLFNNDFATALDCFEDLLLHYFGVIGAILAGPCPSATVRKHGRELTKRLELAAVVESFERVTATQLQRYCHILILLGLYDEKKLVAISDRFPYSRLESLFSDQLKPDHYHRSLVTMLRNPDSANWRAHAAWLIRSVNHVELTFFLWDEELSLQRVRDGVRYELNIHMCADCEDELVILKYILNKETENTFRRVVRDNKGVLTSAICSESQNSDDHEAKFELLLFLVANSEFIFREMFEREETCKKVLDKVDRLLHGKKWEKLIGRLYTTLVKEYGATCRAQIAAIERRFSSARDFDMKEYVP